jgi:hypothetical protein
MSTKLSHPSCPGSELAIALVSVVSAALGAAPLGGCAADSGGSSAPNAASGGAGPAGGSGGVGVAGGTGNPTGGRGNGGTTAPGTGGGSTGGGTAMFNAGTDPNRNQVPNNQVCDRVATIQCAGEAFCCSAPGRTFDACKATMKQGCIDQLYLDAITSNPVAGYDQAAASRTFTDYENKASQCDVGVTAWGASVDGLRGLPKGTLNGGASCLPPLDQITNRPVAAAYLAACKNAATTACYPNQTGITWTCSPRGNAGNPCFADTNCNDGLYCDNPTFALAGGQCKTRKPEGAACALLNECQSLLCKRSQCVPVSKDNTFCLNAN